MHLFQNVSQPYKVFRHQKDELSFPGSQQFCSVFMLCLRDLLKKQYPTTPWNHICKQKAELAVRQHKSIHGKIVQLVQCDCTNCNSQTFQKVIFPYELIPPLAIEKIDLIHMYFCLFEVWAYLTFFVQTMASRPKIKLLTKKKLLHPQI